MMKGWNELGVVDTIYEEVDPEEEENEVYESKSLSLSPSIITTSPIFSSQSSSSLLSPPPSLHAKVEEWSRSTGCETDVVIRLNDRSFNLHKEPLVTQSRYLRSRLSESTDVTINPPSNITAEIFTEIVIFCYDSFINLTPSNLAAVRIAADWLEMDASSANGDRDGSLMWQTEVYFRQEITCDAENAGHVLLTCVSLLPDVTAALLAVRSVEVLAREGADGAWMEELTALTADGFTVIVESMRTWFLHDHDLLYRIVDFYLGKHENLTEEEKNRLCHAINCTKLSHHHLLHLVQNPRLPLRFIVQAMLVDQLQTHHAYLHLSSSTSSPSSSRANLTLGAMLRRDATLRQASHVQASMEATCLRVESLERDLEGLRRKLRWTEEKRAEVESVKSSSFRVVSTNKSCNSASSGSVLVKSEKGFGKKLMDGLKSVFVKTASSKGRGHQRNKSFA